MEPCSAANATYSRSPSRCVSSLAGGRTSAETEPTIPGNGAWLAPSTNARNLGHMRVDRTAASPFLVVSVRSSRYGRDVEMLRVAAIAVACATFGEGCERGCLAAWMRDHGAGTGSQASGASGSGLDPSLLSGTDCSDGLARCVDGRVEVSRLAHLPAACGSLKSGAPEKAGAACACPWDAVSQCACAEPGMEIVAAPDVASEQLCRPAEVVARPLSAVDAPPSDVCSSAGTECRDGFLRACDAPGRPVRALGICVNGCESRVALAAEPSAAPAAGGASPTLDGIAGILCRRAHAERR